MIIRINKDFLTEYKDDFWKGFNFKECVCLLIGGGFGVGGAYLAHKITGLDPATAVYFGVPLALPPVIYGFYKYQGYMEVKRLIYEMYYSYKCRRLTFQESNIRGTVKFSMKERDETKRRKGRKRWE